MVNTRSCGRERILLTMVVFISLMSMVMVGLLFTGIKADNIAEIITKSEITYTNVSIVNVPERFVNIWNDRYESENTEFIYCLYGSSNENGFTITEIETTEVIAKEEDSITFMSCHKNKKYLGNIHSHPQPEERYLKSTCDLSKQDIYTFGSDKQLITGVICGENKFAVYGIGDFDNSFEINIFKEDNK